MSVQVSSKHKNHQQLHQELVEARQQVSIGGIYAHYKFPENTYQVTGLGILEATDEVCVLYQATYDPELVFVRPLSSWLETPTWNGQKVERFSLVS
jgi:hypothetical protein